jgi:transcriptional regulator with XRE-family HTH domain
VSEPDDFPPPRPPRPAGPSPSSARRRLGSELRAVRESVRLTLEEGAAGIQRSPATLSRLENGKSTPRLVDVRALLDEYADRDPAAVPDGLRRRLLDLADTGRSEGWFAAFRDVTSSDMTYDDIKRYVEFENDAAVIRSFEPDVVPGLLQTRGYSAALTGLFFPTRSPARRQRLVEFRLARRRVLRLHGGHVAFDAVIGEVALRREIAPPAVMREQLEAILAMIDDNGSAVRIRIAPIELGIRAVHGGPFVIMEFVDPDEVGLVYLEGRAGAQYLQTGADVEVHRRQFDELLARSLDRAASRAMIEDLRRGLG